MDEKLKIIMDTQNDLIREIAVLGQKIENLTATSSQLVEDIKIKDARLDALEKSRTQLMTIFGAFIFAVTTFGGAFVYVGSKYVDARFDQKLRESDLTDIICDDFREKHNSDSELPRICR